MTNLASMDELTGFLQGRDASDQVLFEADGEGVGLGYHVTELRLARISSIDCGGVSDAWDETQMQVLDAPGDAAMSAGKLVSILRRSANEISGLNEAPLTVEFGHSNKGLGRFQMGAPKAARGVVTIPLTPLGPECKAMTRAFQQKTATECCDRKTAPPAC